MRIQRQFEPEWQDDFQNQYTTLNSSMNMRQRNGSL